MQKIQKQFSFDGISRQEKKQKDFDYNLAQFILKNKNSSVLFSSKFGRMQNFTTPDSKLYFNQSVLGDIRAGKKLADATGRFDCAMPRVSYFEESKVRKYRYVRKQETQIYFEIKERYSTLAQYLKDVASGYTHGVGMVRMWNVSLIGSLIFGMFLMTMIYRYLGQGARASESASATVAEQALENKNETVLGTQTADSDDEQRERDAYTAKLLAEVANKKNSEFEKTLREMVKGYPIEKMVSEIAKQDRTVAVFLVAIAKKESSWGVHAPVLDGEDCLNYWGFRKKRERMGTGGHTCFDDVPDAVSSAARRISSLVYDEKIDTPEKMVKPWKCGYDCSWDNPAAVQKWIDDVEYYFGKLDARG